MDWPTELCLLPDLTIAVVVLVSVESPLPIAKRSSVARYRLQAGNDGRPEEARARRDGSAIGRIGAATIGAATVARAAVVRVAQGQDLIGVPEQDTQRTRKLGKTLLCRAARGTRPCLLQPEETVCRIQYQLALSPARRSSLRAIVAASDDQLAPKRVNSQASADSLSAAFILSSVRSPLCAQGFMSDMNSLWTGL
jgi:hypothetical protein